MLGLLVIGLTLFMIYTLVKNALFGKQITNSDHFTGTIDLILPIEQGTRFYREEWSRALTHLRGVNLKIHVLIDGHHPEIESWRAITQMTGLAEVNSFLTRPVDIEAVPWMIQQIYPRLTGDVVIVGDPELVPTEVTFSSLARIVKDKERVYITLPQTAKKNILGEAISLLSPTLAFASFYGFKKFRRTLSHPFLSISEAWLAMPREVFTKIQLNTLKDHSWKVSFMTALENAGVHVFIAFGEKHLIRQYPEFFEDYLRAMRDEWGALWASNRKSFWFFVGVMFVWSFPVICLMTHPIWAMVSISLLLLYRFFSKIVFQESWIAVFLHPVASLAWLTTLVWWIATSARANKGTGTIFKT